jgi:hypothetical protein
MTKIKRPPWISAHRGTKKDIAIGRDYCRVGPANEVEDPDAQCVHVFGPDKLRRAGVIVTAVNAYDKQRALIETLTKALEEIRDVQPQEFNAYPADWQEQRDACDDCQRYKDHPLMRGICDTHRKPMYDRESHDAHQIRALGYRAKSMARDALAAAKEISA